MRKKQHLIPTWILILIDAILAMALVMVIGMWRFNWFSVSQQNMAYIDGADEAENYILEDNAGNAKDEFTEAKPIYISIISDNEILLHIEDDYLKELSDNNGQLINGFQFETYIENDGYFSVTIDAVTWNATYFMDENREFPMYLQGDINPSDLANGIIDIDINMIDLGSNLLSGTFYYVYLIDEEWVYNCSLDGDTKDIIVENMGDSVAQESISVFKVSDDALTFNISDETIINQIKESGVTIYFSPDANKSQIAIQINIDRRSNTRFGITVFVENEMVNTADNRNLEGEFADGEVAFRVEYEGIAEAIMDNPYYQVCKLYEDDLYIVGKIDCSGSDTSEYYDLLPMEMIDGDLDKTYFTPTSDKFRIVEFNYANASFPKVGWYTDPYGILYFGCADVRNTFEEKSDIKLVYLLSYDDVSVIDIKAKVVYQDSSMAKRATIGYTSLICPYDITGNNAQDDELIENMKEEWLSEAETKFIYDSYSGISGTEITYYGLYDNVRYFGYSPVLTNNDDGSILMSLPISSQASYDGKVNTVEDASQKYNYENGKFVDNKSFDDAFTIRTYSSY